MKSVVAKYSSVVLAGLAVLFVLPACPFWGNSPKVPQELLKK